jgi:hypothetical protein
MYVEYVRRSSSPGLVTESLSFVPLAIPLRTRADG